MDLYAELVVKLQEPAGSRAEVAQGNAEPGPSRGTRVTRAQASRSRASTAAADVSDIQLVSNANTVTFLCKDCFGSKSIVFISNCPYSEVSLQSECSACLPIALFLQNVLTLSVLTKRTYCMLLSCKDLCA